MAVRIILLSACLAAAIHFGAFAQANFSTTGNWNVASNWDSNNIGDAGENVTTNNNRSPTIVSGDNYSIGSMAANGDLTIQSGGTLTLGTSALFDAGTDKNLTFNNNSVLTVAGTLEIWGDLIVNNSLTLNITGNVIVHGDVVMANGGALSVSGSGSLTVGGNLTGGNNTQVTTSGSGTIAVTGSIALGGGTSSISGPAGSITAGSCTCGACGGACPSTVTPIKILYFQVKLISGSAELKWATIREENFNKFIIQRSDGDLIFEDIADVPGQGKDTYDLVSKYSFTDPSPVIGYNYYRLKALDINNSYEIFNVRAIKYEGIQSVNAYPNPFVGDALKLTTNFSPAEGDRIRVINTFGRELFNSDVVNNTIELGLFKSIGPGVYFIQYVGRSYTETVRVIVP